MYTAWTSTLIDLNSLNVNQENLVFYTNNLDSLIKALEKENKVECLKLLSNSFTLMTSYYDEYSEDPTKQNVYQTKSNILSAYALVDEDNWEDINIFLTNAQTIFLNIVNSPIENSSKISNINKAYILLNQLKTSAENEDRNTFYINYKNVMKELDVLNM